MEGMLVSEFQKEDFMRHLIFKADSESELIDALSNINGYELVDIQRTDRSFGDDQRFLLKADSGQEIMVLHKEGDRIAETANVFGQDSKEEPTPVAADEVVKLCRAAQAVSGLTASATLSNHDMGFSRAEFEE